MTEDLQHPTDSPGLAAGSDGRKEEPEANSGQSPRYAPFTEPEDVSTQSDVEESPAGVGDAAGDRGKVPDSVNRTDGAGLSDKSDPSDLSDLSASSSPVAVAPSLFSSADSASSPQPAASAPSDSAFRATPQPASVVDSYIRQEWEAALGQAFDAGAGDVVCVAGQVPCGQIQGYWIPVSGVTPFAPDRLKAWIGDMADDKAREDLTTRGEAIFARSWGTDGRRFRATARKEANGYSLSLRLHPGAPPPLAALQAPKVFEPLLGEPGGLIVIGGPSGSGRTTLLAAAIDHINTASARRIACVGAPLEFLPSGKQSTLLLFDARPRGGCPILALQSLRSHDLDVIAVDVPLSGDNLLEALVLAQSGALVFLVESGLSTKYLLASLMGRLPASRRRLAQGILAESLRAVIIQCLVSRADGQGRLPAHEILLQSRSLADPLREGRWEALPKIMTTARPQGMRVLDDTLDEYLRQNWITGPEAYQKALDKTRFIAFGPPEWQVVAAT